MQAAYQYLCRYLTARVKKTAKHAVKAIRQLKEVAKFHHWAALERR